MALKGFMQIKDAQGNIVTGEALDFDHTDWIEIWGGNHAVKLPTTQNGLPNGRRIHFPIKIIKQVDRASALLNQFLSTGTLLQEVIIDWCRVNPKTSMTEAYFRQTLSQVQVNAVCFTMQQLPSGPQHSHAQHNMGHMESVEFIYDDIIWTILDGGIEFDDSQKPQSEPTNAKPAQKEEKPLKKKHRVHINVEADGNEPLPDRHKATIVVIKNASDSIIVKQPKDLIHEPESRAFKLEAGEAFKVYCIPPHLDTALDDLRKNDNLNQTEADGLIAPLAIQSTESRQDDVTVHITEYRIPGIKEFNFSA